jgi:coenzyme F420-dependent glucose-6-phosphate dehydrogenase
MVTSHLKLGHKASAEQFAPRELVELGVAAEAAGMDSATVSDHSGRGATKEVTRRSRCRG